MSLWWMYWPQGRFYTKRESVIGVKISMGCPWLQRVRVASPREDLGSNPREWVPTKRTWRWLGSGDKSSMLDSGFGRAQENDMKTQECKIYIPKDSILRPPGLNWGMFLLKTSSSFPLPIPKPPTGPSLLLVLAVWLWMTWAFDSIPRLRKT